MMKNQLRLILKAQRQKLLRQQSYQAALTEQLNRLLNQLSRTPKILGTYSPLPSEIPPPLLSGGSFQTAYPIHYQYARVLQFKIASAQNQSHFKIGRYNIKIPNQTLQSCRPDCVLVPLLGFNTNKYRLGYGGGYYDATIRQYRCKILDTIWIGVGLEGLKVESLPVEPHDQKLDYVITEKAIYQ